MTVFLNTQGAFRSIVSQDPQARAWALYSSQENVVHTHVQRWPGWEPLFLCHGEHQNSWSSGHPRAAGSWGRYYDNLECSLSCPLPLVLGKNTVTVPCTDGWKCLTLLVNQKAFEKMQEEQWNRSIEIIFYLCTIAFWVEGLESAQLKHSPTSSHYSPSVFSLPLFPPWLLVHLPALLFSVE